MSDSIGAILGAVVLAAVGVGGVLVVLAGGDGPAFTDTAASVAGPALLVVAVLTGVAVLKN